MISKDPYKILGVSPTASDAEIKSAYKELVKKYHPDQYQDNPLADVAEEKMSEINAAYDQIMTSRRGGGYQSAESGYDGYASSQGFDSGYIRSLIQSGSYTQADQILDNVWVTLVEVRHGWNKPAIYGFCEINLAGVWIEYRSQLITGLQILIVHLSSAIHRTDVLLMLSSLIFRSQPFRCIEPVL